MKRQSKYFFICLLFSFCIVLKAHAAVIWVAVNGSDKNDGTKEKPLATVAMALRKARELRRLNDPSIKDGIHIKVVKGIYQFYEPLFIRPEDSGTESSPTIIENADKENPVFSGGINITGWQKSTGIVKGLPKKSQNKIWVADAPTVAGNVLNYRQLWINNLKAIRAKSATGDSMDRILSWDHETESCEIPKPNIDPSNTEGIEMFIQQWWAIAILRIKKIQVKGDSARLTFYQPESRIESEHPWPAPWLSKKTGNSPFYLTNAIQFLDEPGEWYLDLKNRKVYYWPRDNENLNTASGIAPRLETLVKVEGTIDHPVSYVLFKGISFMHTGWLRPSEFGHVPLQAGMYLLDAYKLKIPGTPDKKGLKNQAWVGRPKPAVEVSYANHIDFESCRFQHLASTGLDYVTGTSNDLIEGNLFKDIGGSAMLFGTFSNEAEEAHLPYNPKDEREVCANEHIVNNIVTDVANEDWGCVGIGAGFVRGINIEHNEVCNLSYTGISVGWGWTKNPSAMRDNKITFNKINHYAKYLYDVAAIYTLSAQPNSEIRNNYIDSIYKAPYPHDPDHWFYLYTDEGSSYFTVKDNWCPAHKFLQNANGPGNVWENNGPQVSSDVKQEAGIQKPYQYLLKEKTIDGNWPINSVKENEYDIKKPEIFKSRNQLCIEVTGKSKMLLNPSFLKNICAKNNIPALDIFEWKNHLVVYDTLRMPDDSQKEIEAAYPNAEVKVYSKLVYEFNESHCSNPKNSNRWSNVVMTANLVKDTSMQNQYLHYHATQFQKWPEVAKGFCNADFQQVVVLKSGRQLMLIISIPKGKTLDELNPKTTENNPCVDEWNSIMKKYQEGIEGTKPGETWVVLKPVF
jgi:hypothetical protein